MMALIQPRKNCISSAAKHKLLYWHTNHYNDVMMSAMVSQITSLMIVNSMVYSGAGQRKHQSSESLAFVRGIHRCPVNSPHKRPVTRKKFPFDDVSMLGSAGLLPLFTRRFHTEIFMRPVSKFSNTCIDDSSVFNSLHAINLVWLL